MNLNEKTLKALIKKRIREMLEAGATEAPAEGVITLDDTVQSPGEGEVDGIMPPGEAGDPFNQTDAYSQMGVGASPDEMPLDTGEPMAPIPGATVGPEEPAMGAMGDLYERRLWNFIKNKVKRHLHEQRTASFPDDQYPESMEIQSLGPEPQVAPTASFPEDQIPQSMEIQSLGPEPVVAPTASFPDDQYPESQEIMSVPGPLTPKRPPNAGKKRKLRQCSGLSRKNSNKPCMTRATRNHGIKLSDLVSLMIDTGARWGVPMGIRNPESSMNKCNCEVKGMIVTIQNLLNKQGRRTNKKGGAVPDGIIGPYTLGSMVDLFNAGIHGNPEDLERTIESGAYGAGLQSFASQKKSPSPESASKVPPPKSKPAKKKPQSKKKGKLAKPDVKGMAAAAKDTADDLEMKQIKSKADDGIRVDGTRGSR